MTIAEEREVWTALENAGLLPIEVLTLPEAATYQYSDENGNEVWRGVSNKLYMVIR